MLAYLPKLSIVKPRLLLLSLLFLSVSCFSITPEEEWTYRYAIVNENPYHRISLIRYMIPKAEDFDTEMTDLVAELLYAYQFDQGRLSKKLMIWCGRFLVKTKRKRYLNLLNEISENADNEKIKIQFLELAEKLDKKKYKPEPAYQIGSYNLDKIKQSYMDYAINSNLKDKKSLSEDIAKKTRREFTIEEMFEQLGVPQHLEMGGAAKVYRLKFYYYYKDLGRGEFYYNKREDRMKFVHFDHNIIAYSLDMPFVKAPESPVEESLAIRMLLSENAKAMSNILRHYTRRNEKPSEDFLEASAEMLAQFIAGKEFPFEEKTFGWVCRVLGKNGNGRYVPLLEELSSDKKNRVSWYARKVLTQTAESSSTLNKDVEIFVPGVFDLEKLKSQYQ